MLVHMCMSYEYYQWINLWALDLFKYLHIHKILILSLLKKGIVYIRMKSKLIFFLSSISHYNFI